MFADLSTQFSQLAQQRVVTLKGRYINLRIERGKQFCQFAQQQNQQLTQQHHKLEQITYQQTEHARTVQESIGRLVYIHVE